MWEAASNVFITSSEKARQRCRCLFAAYLTWCTSSYRFCCRSLFLLPLFQFLLIFFLSLLLCLFSLFFSYSFLSFFPSTPPFTIDLRFLLCAVRALIPSVVGCLSLLACIFLFARAWVCECAQVLRWLSQETDDAFSVTFRWWLHQFWFHNQAAVKNRFCHTSPVYQCPQRIY